MKDIKSIIGGIILVVLIFTGAITFLLELYGGFIKVTLWLFQLSLTDFGLSPIVEVLVKAATFLLSYALVGIIFNALHFFDSDIMKFVYFVISTLIGFALSAVMMFLQNHIVVISWTILGIFIITVISILLVIKKRNTLKG